MIMINLILIALVTACFGFRSIMEALCFKDKESAKQTFRYWCVSVGSLVLSFGFSLLLYYTA